jgi:hypothetical protein
MEADEGDIGKELLEAIKAQVGISKHRQKIKDIKDLLEEPGDLMDAEEKQALRKKLYELRNQSVNEGEGGVGV